MFDGGVLINVLGRLQVRMLMIAAVLLKQMSHVTQFFNVANSQTDGDPPHAYTQTFILKPIGNSFFVQHDVFRLALHDM